MVRHDDHQGVVEGARLVHASQVRLKVVVEDLREVDVVVGEDRVVHEQELWHAGGIPAVELFGVAEPLLKKRRLIWGILRSAGSRTLIWSYNWNRNETKEETTILNQNFRV